MLGGELETGVASPGSPAQWVGQDYSGETEWQNTMTMANRLGSVLVSRTRQCRVLIALFVRTYAASGSRAEPDYWPDLDMIAPVQWALCESY